MKKPFDTRQLRNAFGAYPTGVAIMSGYRQDGSAVGVTASSFVSVSLDPPLISWCLANESSSRSAFMEGARFAVTVLGEEHCAVALRFASRTVRHFDVSFRKPHADAPAPIVDGEICRLDCEVMRCIEAGDHQIILSSVRSLRSSNGKPLVFHGGRFGRLLTTDHSPKIDIWAHFGNAWNE